MKLDGRELDPNKKMSVTDQVSRANYIVVHEIVNLNVTKLEVFGELGNSIRLAGYNFSIAG